MTNSNLNKLEILQFFLDESKIILIRKKPWYCLNSFNFEKNKNENSVKPGRKKFRMHVNELLQEKLITRIITNDKRSKFFSITPWGICYLINSLEFEDIPRIKKPNHITIFKILETFATKYVKPYKSHVINNNQMNFENFYENFISKFWEKGWIEEEIPNVFSSFKSSIYAGTQFFIPLSVHSEIEMPIAKFEVKNYEGYPWNKKGIEITELGHSVGDNKKVFSTILNDEQFHHYLAIILLYFTIYYHVKIDSDYNIGQRENSKKKMTEEQILNKLTIKRYPEEILQILLSFNSQISNLLEEQSNLVKELHQSLNQLQFQHNF